MKEILIQLLAAFFGSLGFTLLFGQRRRYVFVSSLGGLFAWAVYLLAERLIGMSFVSNLLAAAFSVLYAELLATLSKDPSTYFVYPSIVPLIPGDLFYYSLAGVYLGELCHTMLKAAAGEGLLSPVAAGHVTSLGWIDSAVIDAWACGEKLETICRTPEDCDFVQTLCASMFQRSARLMCTNLAAILLLTGEGTDADRPVCICAEGSLVQKGRVYRPYLEKMLHEEVEGKLGRHVVLRVGSETTLSGSAAAALLNLR